MLTPRERRDLDRYLSQSDDSTFDESDDVEFDDDEEDEEDEEDDDDSTDGMDDVCEGCGYPVRECECDDDGEAS